MQYFHPRTIQNLQFQCTANAVLHKQDLGRKIITLFLSPPILLSLPRAQCRTESTHGFRGGKFSLWGLQEKDFIGLMYWHIGLFLGENTLKAIISPEIGIYDAERSVTLLKGQALRAVRILGEQ